MASISRSKLSEMAVTLVYTTTQDITTVLTPHQQQQLTDDVATGDDSTNHDRIDEFLAFAESFADSYAKARYTVPLTTPVPRVYLHHILIIAKYHLSLRMDFVTEEIRQEYADAVAWFEQLRDGFVQLDVDDDDLNDSVLWGAASTEPLEWDADTDRKIRRTFGR